MSKRLLLVMLILSLALSSGCFGLKPFKLVQGGKVALIEVKGIIIEPDDVNENLETARKDDDIKAVVVRVDSPGGSVAASQEIFHAIKELNKKKPVVVSMGDVAASGGYYVSAGAGKIFADQGTVTGSIGVRLEHMNVKGLFDLVRVEPETLKSGKFKDIGSSIRPMSPEERKILEDFLAELHGQFKADIVSSRGLEKNFVDEIGDGRIYTGVKAKEMKLIDEIGGLADAVKEAAKMAGIKGDPKIEKLEKERPWWRDIFEESASLLTGRLKDKILGHKYFLFEWKP